MGQAADLMRRDIGAFNARDVEEIMAIHGSDCEKVDPGARLRGGDQVVAWRSALWDAFPDLQLEVARVVEEGPAVAIQGVARGTHRGTLRSPGADIPPTGRSVECTWSDYYEVQGGQIVSTRLHFDQLGILEQTWCDAHVCTLGGASGSYLLGLSRRSDTVPTQCLPTPARSCPPPTPPPPAPGRSWGMAVGRGRPGRLSPSSRRSARR